jgi:hypothetical protein
MKKFVLFFVFIFGAMTAAGNAAADEIAWLYLQHREYGDRAGLNRLSFGLVDEEANYVTDKSAVNSIQLTDPSGNPVDLASVEFGSVDEIYGNYDAKNSRWYFDANWRYDSWFSVDVKAPLVEGLYVLSVTTADGRKTERDYRFNRQVDLPIIRADSIGLRADASGNLIWTWRIPDQLGALSFNHPMRARASIDIYDDERYAGYFSVILPVHVGFVCIPKNVLQKINHKGNRFEVMISLETRDKNNRTYSKKRAVNQKLPPS